MKNLILRPEIFLDAAMYLEDYSCFAIMEACERYKENDKLSERQCCIIHSDNNSFYRIVTESYYKNNHTGDVHSHKYDDGSWWNSFSEDKAEEAEDCRLYALLFAYELAKDFVNETEEKKELYRR